MGGIFIIFAFTFSYIMGPILAASFFTYTDSHGHVVELHHMLPDNKTGYLENLTSAKQSDLNKTMENYNSSYGYTQPDSSTGIMATFLSIAKGLVDFYITPTQSFDGSLLHAIGWNAFTILMLHVIIGIVNGASLYEFIKGSFL